MFKMEDYLKFDKNVAMYHGLGSAPNVDRNKTFTKLGYNVLSELHDYKHIYEVDCGEKFFKAELEKVKGFDLIVGLSFGGYISYNLSLATGIPCILINPALDRAKSVWTNSFFKMEYEKINSDIEVFCGVNDKSVLPTITSEYLKENNPTVEINYIDIMAHRVPHIYFSKIIKSSKLVNRDNI